MQEVKVLSLGSKAEYGSYSGAAVDVLTKTGGNELHGTASYYTQLGDAGDNYTTDFGSDWLYVDPADDITTEPVDNTELSLTLGGPILKDKLWFYGTYGKQDIRLQRLAGTPDQTLLPSYNFKLNWQATSKTMVSAFYFLGSKQ